tara:strand:- start:22046 stop:23236 length:1191 start_codon:yes stop_codon:yes gene_type:complete
MRKDRIYIGFLVFAILLYVLVEIMKPKPIDWSNDFTRTASIPYGTEILFDEINTLFPDSEIQINTRTLYEFYDNEEFSPRNWIFINDAFQLDPLETEELLYSVENGANAFISGVITGKLADTLNLAYNFYFALLDSVSEAGNQTVSFKNPAINKENGWTHSIRTNFYYFTSYDTSKTEVLGNWNQNQVNFIKISWGKGNFYLNSTPHLFTNYYLRKPEQAKYAFTALSYLPIQNTVWDGYYKSGRNVAGTPLSIVLSTDGLKQAWYLALITLLLFMIFKARREQRIIPIIQPPKNSSIQFAETIGELYLEQGSHSEILEKKLKFFYEYIINHLRLNPSTIDMKFKTALSQRSGIEKQEILKLFDLIELSGSSQKVSQTQLTLITKKIDEFYKKSQR